MEGRVDMGIKKVASARLEVGSGWLEVVKSDTLCDNMYAIT